MNFIYKIALPIIAIVVIAIIAFVSYLILSGDDSNSALYNASVTQTV